jgi:hypothetical protein
MHGQGDWRNPIGRQNIFHVNSTTALHRVNDLSIDLELGDFGALFRVYLRASNHSCTSTRRRQIVAEEETWQRIEYG